MTMNKAQQEAIESLLDSQIELIKAVKIQAEMIELLKNYIEERSDQIDKVLERLESKP